MDIRFLKMKSDAISHFIIIIVNHTKTQVQYIICTYLLFAVLVHCDICLFFSVEAISTWSCGHVNK